MTQRRKRIRNSQPGRGRRRHRHGRKWRGGIGRATALPFLTRASWVTVIELCTSDEHDAAQLRVRDVAKYLERRGARCRYGVHVHMAEPDARYLIRLARNEGADSIVTEAVGHSRLGEWMRGGMTRGLLQEAPICLMMSH